MRKIITATVLALITMLMFSACERKAASSNKEAYMPAPFGENAPDTGGDERMKYYDTLGLKMTGLSISFELLVDTDEYEEWRLKTNRIDNDTTNIRDVFGIYSFITYFDIADETVIDILKKEREAYISFNTPGDVYFTDEEIDLLLSRDDAKIAEYFIQPYSIAKDGNVYSPKWSYTHSIEDYEKAGLSAELISEKAEAFTQILPFTDEAKVALENKLTEYQQLQPQSAE